ncbi:MAG TPA: SIR2 family protein, partial [Methylobacter sp.]
MEAQVAFFINKYVEELTEENAAIFAGAGLSVAAGIVDWKNLLLPIAQQLGLDISKEHDLVSLAQHHCNERSGNRHELNQRLINEFSKGHAITENHRILARLPIRTFWTTNYDRLIEKALEDTGKIADVKYTVKQLALTKAKRDAIVYKMQGDVEHPDDAVLTKDDYERYHIDRQPFVTAISGDMVSKTFLFLGFSFTDPNLDYILSRIRVTFTTSQRQHYCIFKKRKRAQSEAEDYLYDALKQELAIKDLKRFNITALLVDEYSEITTILKAIEDRFCQKTVLISGSANVYGEFAAPEKFIQDLSQLLIQ